MPLYFAYSLSFYLAIQLVSVGAISLQGLILRGVSIEVLVVWYRVFMIPLSCERYKLAILDFFNSLALTSETSSFNSFAKGDLRLMSWANGD